MDDGLTSYSLSLFNIELNLELPLPPTRMHIQNFHLLFAFLSYEKCFSLSVKKCIY